jgi:hypothetical protein
MSVTVSHVFNTTVTDAVGTSTPGVTYPGGPSTGMFSNVAKLQGGSYQLQIQKPVGLLVRLTQQISYHVDSGSGAEWITVGSFINAAADTFAVYPLTTLAPLTRFVVEHTGGTGVLKAAIVQVVE